MPDVNQYIEIPLPDEECRRKIWKLHLPDTFPIAEDVVLSELAKIDDICGREIRNAVQCVAESMAIDGVEKATLRMFQDEIDRIKKERIAKESKKTTLTLKDDEKDVFTEVLNEVTSKKVRSKIKEKGILLMSINYVSLEDTVVELLANKEFALAKKTSRRSRSTVEQR